MDFLGAGGSRGAPPEGFGVLRVIGVGVQCQLLDSPMERAHRSVAGPQKCSQCSLSPLRVSLARLFYLFLYLFLYSIYLILFIPFYLFFK